MPPFMVAFTVSRIPHPVILLYFFSKSGAKEQNFIYKMKHFNSAKFLKLLKYFKNCQNGSFWALLSCI
jgi:hypothetical protein